MYEDREGGQTLGFTATNELSFSFLPTLFDLNPGKGVNYGIPIQKR